MKTRPILIGISNAILPGLGYVLAGVRTTFGWLLLIGGASCVILAVIEPTFMSETFFISQTSLGMFFETIWYVFFLAAFGYDAWDLARKNTPVAVATTEEPLPTTETPTDEPS
jgi:hypothetical protein